MEKEICLVQQTLERKKKEEEQEEEEGATKSFGHEMFFVFFACLFCFFLYEMQGPKRKGKVKEKIKIDLSQHAHQKLLQCNKRFFLLHPAP